MIALETRGQNTIPRFTKTENRDKRRSSASEDVTPVHSSKYSARFSKTANNCSV